MQGWIEAWEEEKTAPAMLTELGVDLGEVILVRQAISRTGPGSDLWTVEWVTEGSQQPA